MNKLDYKDYLRGVHKLMGSILSVEDKSRSKKIIDYLRIYTDILQAMDLLNKKTYKQAVHRLKNVKRFTKQVEFKEEETYMEKINEIATSVLSNIRCIKCTSTDCEICNPAHARTKMQLAQNICILRILKNAT